MDKLGFSAVETVIVILVLGLVGFAGYTVYDRSRDNEADDNATAQHADEESATADDVSTAPEIDSSADLDVAEAVLDQNDPDNSYDADAAQLDSQTADF